MSNQATKDDIDEVINLVKDFMGQVSREFDKVNTEFAKVNTEFAKVNTEFDKVNHRLDKLDEKYDHLINTIDGFIGRIDKYEVELAARDAQFDRLLDWARKVSVKTGVPLIDL